jgi:hypothetical protein
MFYEHLTKEEWKIMWKSLDVTTYMPGFGISIPQEVLTKAAELRDIIRLEIFGIKKPLSVTEITFEEMEE